MAAPLAIRSLAATDAQCSGILQRALDARNPETRKRAVVALSLASGRGPLFDQLVVCFINSNLYRSGRASIIEVPACNARCSPNRPDS